MKRTYLSGVTVAMALVAGRHALAEGPETQQVGPIIEYIEFITQNSSLEYAGQDLPHVTVVSEDELQLLFRSSDAEVFAKEDDRALALVSAFYDRAANHTDSG